jgi:hypothetical protein
MAEKKIKEKAQEVLYEIIMLASYNSSDSEAEMRFDKIKAIAEKALKEIEKIPDL